jgi:hypothetical protein
MIFPKESAICKVLVRRRYLNPGAFSYAELVDVDTSFPKTSDECKVWVCFCNRDRKYFKTSINEIEPVNKFCKELLKTFKEAI